MNYLTHLFFSQRTPNSFAGNLMGDFKPSSDLLSQLPVEVINGIANHRLVDKTTDQFQPVKDLKPLFSKARRRYAGVVTDIAFDYFLIKHWESYTSMPFNDFTKLAYAGLDATQSMMPPRMQYVTKAMIENNWLETYSTLDGVGRSIDFVSERIRFKNNMAGSIEEIRSNYDQVEEVFLLLFSHLKQVVEEQKLEKIDHDLYLNTVQ